jgi:hypothetical protein
MAALQFGAAHPGAYPLDDQVPLQLGDRADDDDDGPPQRAASVDVLPEADELDLQVIEFVEYFEEVADGAGEPVRRPYQHDVKPAAARIPHQFIETRALGLGPADLVGVLADDLIPALAGQLLEIMQLAFGMLIDGRYPHIKDGARH